MYVTPEEMVVDAEKRSRQKRHIRQSYIDSLERALVHAEQAQAELDSALTRARMLLDKVRDWES